MDERKEYTYSKAQWRGELLSRRNAVADKPELSRIIADRVLPTVYGNVMVYASIGSEVDTSRIIDELLKRDDVCLYAPYTQSGVIVPRKVKSRAKADRFGNLPQYCYIDVQIPSRLDFCITPLLGFNEQGYRIGYGKGCYDRFFAEWNTVKIGLAFAEQQIKFEPDRTDIPLDCCVTDKSVIYF